MTKDQLFQTLWGSALADAIGNPLEFISEVSDEDFQKSAGAKVLHCSDDTQMTLFAYEALTQNVASPEKYIRWYQTQNPQPQLKSDGLLQFQSMFTREAPGVTCMGSCYTLMRGGRVDNDSKGNGTVMRAAPFAVHAHLKGWSPEAAYAWAKDDALLTHKHQFAWQSSVLLVAILLKVFNGKPLRESILESVAEIPSCEDVGKIITQMLFKGNYEAMRNHRCGWVAEEALALALGANIHNTGYLNKVRDACKGTNCDSDTVAGIAGAISAALGDEVPQAYLKRLSIADAIQYIIDLY